MRFSLCLLFVGLASGASVDVNDKAALGRASGSAVKKLMTLFDQMKDGTTGSFDQGSVSWFQSGMIWGAIFDHSRFTGDRTYDTLAATSLANASFNDVQDLLGGDQRSFQEKTLGKWNDDIAWWALSMMSGVELYGNNAVMPGGGTFLSVAIVTWNEMIEQWDTICGGGIYWSRDRTSQNANSYKNSITNGEFIALSARLALATKNQTYVEWAERAYAWMKSTGLISSTWQIYDGFNAPACSTLDQTLWSYNAGILLHALPYMYKVTSKQAYLDDAAKLLSASIAQFASSGAIAEACEAQNNCRRDTPSFKGQLVKGLAYLYKESTDANVKAQIQRVIDTAFNNMISSCDNDWWCSKIWTGGSALDRDVYNQYPAIELFIAAAVVHGATSTATSGALPVGGTSGAAGADQSSSADWSGKKWSLEALVCALTLGYYLL